MNYTESDLEDWAEFNLGPLIHEDAICLDRQVTLPSGRRLDLLFGHPDETGHPHLTVVEMKRGRPGASAVAQLCDYMDEIDGSNHGIAVFGLLVSDGHPDNEAMALLRRLPRVGCVDLEPRLECHARHSLWGWGNQPKPTTLAGHCQHASTHRGDEALSAINSVVSDYLDQLHGYMIAHRIGEHTQQALLGPGGTN